MRTKKISGIVLFLLIFTHIGFCQTDWFTGHVYDTITGESIQGAVIYAGNGEWPPYGDVYSDTTGINGYYSIEVPIADDYTVLAIAPGFISKNFTFQEPYEAIEFPLLSMPIDFLVETINMGLVHYDYNGIFCYREDGFVEQSEDYFPDIDQQSGIIDMLLDEIGAGIIPTIDDSLLYAKLNIIWLWFRDNTWYAPSDPDWIIANAYMNEGGWPSIHRIASTYYKFGVIPWGSCTSKGQVTTTLLYRSGFPKNRVLMVEARSKLRYSQHYTVLTFIHNRWLYFDPQYYPSDLPSYEEFGSYPPPDETTLRSMDWCNSHTGYAIPGSSLQRTPVAIDRENNSKNIVITSPPCYTHTFDFLIDVEGVCENELINEVQVNGKFYPVVDGRFNAEEIYLPNFQNIVTAKVTVGDADYTYAIEIFRDDPIMSITQFVDLPAGYTGISSYVTPEYTSVFLLFELIQDHFIFLRNFNQFYIPQMGINTIENWDTHSGYIARMSVHDSVEFYGLEVRNKTVEFNMEHNGWNLLPVLSTNDFYRVYLTDSLGSSYDIIKEIGGEELWWPGFGGDLYLLRKDKTYFIKVNEACSFTFWDYNYITDKPARKEKTIEYPWNDVIKTGFSHLIAFNNSDLQGISGTMQGDPIGAFTPDGLCVGIAVYDTAFNYTILTAFADDELSESEIEGFIAGEEMYFRLYQEGNNKEFHLIVQYNQQFPNADGKYAVNGVSVISEVSAEPFSINELLFDNYAQVYPNPNSGLFNINLKNDYKINNIRIIDIHAKEIDFQVSSKRNRQIQIIISGNTSGIHFLELNIDQNIIISKIIIY